MERRQAPRTQPQHGSFANLIYIAASEQLLINVNSVFAPAKHWTWQLQTIFRTLPTILPSRKFCFYIFMFMTKSNFFNNDDDDYGEHDDDDGNNNNNK